MALKITKSEFYRILQQILEEDYLQPLQGHKKNIKDGKIERTIHGATHASRATLWAATLHELLKKMTPDYVNSSFKTIAAQLQTDEETVLYLILITMACHDSARRGEGYDLWEKQSSEKASSRLQTLGLTQDQARLFSNAILFKDQPEEYDSDLESLGIEQGDRQAFGYIRQLVNLGDNLELVRCVGSFKTIYIFETLAGVQGFDVDKQEPDILRLILAIHQFVHHQGDMRFPCTILGRKNQILAALPAHFDLEKKLALEQADKIFEGMVEKAQSDSLLKKYLQTGLFAQDSSASAKIQIPKPAAAPPADEKKSDWLNSFFSNASQYFDPFIHGTNSSLFALLPKTEFQLLSPLEMMDDYQSAPLSGELESGGYRAIGYGLNKENNPGQASFAKLRGQTENDYCLQSVLAIYTKHKIESKEDILAKFKKERASLLKRACSNLNILLIYFTRARQVCDSLEEILTETELKQAQNDMELMIQFYHFFLLLSIHIHPDFEAIAQSGRAEEIAKAAYYQFSFERIIAQIAKLQLDLKDTLQNPTPEKLQKALKILEFDENTPFPQRQYFCLKPGAYSASLNRNYADYSINYEFSAFSQKMDSSYGIGAFLGDLLANKRGPDQFFKPMGEKVKEYLIAFEDRRRLFNKLLQTPQSSFQLTTPQKSHLQNPFPLILLSENKEKFYAKKSGEYRAHVPLKLGTDINMIATDTPAHAKQILQFLEQHQIQGVALLLFDDLKVGFSRPKDRTLELRQPESKAETRQNKATDLPSKSPFAGLVNNPNSPWVNPRWSSRETKSETRDRDKIGYGPID